MAGGGYNQGFDDDGAAHQYDTLGNPIASATVEVIAGEIGTFCLPPLPLGIRASSMVLHDGMILLCGGECNVDKKCFQLENGTWKEEMLREGIGWARFGQANYSRVL